jgi:hypothetical protein
VGEKYLFIRKSKTNDETDEIYIADWSKASSSCCIRKCCTAYEKWCADRRLQIWFHFVMKRLSVRYWCKLSKTEEIYIATKIVCAWLIKGAYEKYCTDMDSLTLYALTCTPHSHTLPYTHTHTHTLERASMRGRAMLDLIPRAASRTVDQTPP